MTQLQSLELEVIQTGGHKEHWVGVRSLGFEPRAPSPAAKGLSVPSLEGQSPFSMGSPTSRDQETQRRLHKGLHGGKQQSLSQKAVSWGGGVWPPWEAH